MIVLSGGGFQPHETVYLELNWGGVENIKLLAKPPSDGSGAFSGISVTVPSPGAFPGQDVYNIDAKGENSGRTANTTITIPGSG